LSEQPDDSPRPTPPVDQAIPADWQADSPDSLQELLDRAGDVSSVDLTRYKTRELKKRFQELFGVVHLLPWAGLGLGGCVVLSMILWAVLFIPTAPFFVALLALVYMLLQGFFLGLLAAALLVIARIFQQLTAIIDMTIQSLRQLFRDVGQFRDPTIRSEVVGGFIHGAIIPAVQGAIAVKLGLLRAPISFVINRILGKTAKKLTKNLERDVDDLAPTPSESPSPSPEKPSTELTSPGETHLDRMQQRVEIIARRTRRATLIPAAIFFAFAAGLSSIPWILVFLGFL
jgi:hypothetical protein